MFLLDTSVVSELRKVGDGRADAGVTAWISQQDATDFYVSALTLMEMEIGILRIERRDEEQGKRLRRWMDQHVLPEFLERTLPVDSTVALRCARLHVPDPGVGAGRIGRRDGHGARHDPCHGKLGRFRSYRCGCHRSLEGDVTVNSEEKTLEVAEPLGFPVAHGVTRSVD